MENNFIFNCNLKPGNIENVPIKNKFWRDLLKYFFELQSKTTETLQEDSIILFNSLLKIEGKTLFYKELHDKGVTYILVIWSMKMVDLKQLMKYGVSLITGLIASITLA